MVSRKAVGGVCKPCRVKHLNFILEIAHFLWKCNLREKNF